MSTILKWLLIILFFPLSLIFIGYYNQKKAKEQYRKRYFAEEQN